MRLPIIVVRIIAAAITATNKSHIINFQRMIDSFYISALLGTAVNGWVEAEGGSDHRK